MTSRLVPVVALVCALLGASAALGIARAVGWVGANKTETVVVRTPRGQVAQQPAVIVRSKPVLGNGFDPAAIYEARSPGVVTIFAHFPGGESQGSGFVVSDDGAILTNAHVITNAAQDPTQAAQGADQVYVEFADGDRVPAEIVGWDVFDDVGVLRVDPKLHALKPLPLGQSAGVRVGDPVAVIGSPFGNENSLSVGVVAATKRSIDSLTVAYDLVDAIQTDAPINHGNSGGPMFDARGRVIGLSAQIRSTTNTAEGVGFAVPIDSARRSLRQLLRDGRVHYAYVGLSTDTLTPSIADQVGYSVDRGAIVVGVTAGSPADKAGFLPGRGDQEVNGETVVTGADVVVAIDGTPVRSAEDLVRIVTEELLPGEVAVFSVVRGEARKTIAARLVERPLRPRGG